MKEVIRKITTVNIFFPFGEVESLLINRIPFEDIIKTNEIAQFLLNDMANGNRLLRSVRLGEVIRRVLFLTFREKNYQDENMEIRAIYDWLSCLNDNLPDGIDVYLVSNKLSTINHSEGQYYSVILTPNKKIVEKF